MPGIRACLYIAVDNFGAEALGHFQALLRDVDNRDILERCRFYWAGLGERPEPSSYWTDSAPAWTHPESTDEPFRWGVEGDPALAPNLEIVGVDKSLLNHIEGLIAGGDALRHLVDGYLADEFGSAELEDAGLVLAGSLTNPGTYELVQGFLAGSAHWRAKGRLAQNPSEYLILGIGHHTSEDTSSEHGRARAGLSLLALDGYFAKAESFDADAVAYVVNEQVDASEGAVLDRRSQVEVAAALAVGLAAEAGRPLVPGEFHPLRFKRMPLVLKSEWGAADYVIAGAAKFAYCGGSALHFPTRALNRILATNLLEGTCRTFAECDPDVLISAGPEVAVDEGLVRILMDETDARLSAQLQSCGLAPDPMPPVWTLAGAESISGHVFGRTWREASAAFGDRLFRRLPLEDWEQTLDDMQEFVTTGLVSRLENDRSALARNLVYAFDQGLEAAFSTATQRALDDDMDFAPRRHCLASLRGIGERIDQAQLQGQEAWRLAEGFDEREMGVFRSRIQEARKRIVDLMNSIPSPQALMLRIAGLLSVFLVLGLALPFDLGLFDPWFMRMGLGSVAALLVLGRSWQMIRSAKRRLMAALDEWVEAQRRYCEVRQTEARHETVQMILAELKRYADWLTAAEDDAPGPFTFKDSEPWRQEGAPDYPLQRRRFLHAFSADMTDSAEAWRLLRRDLIATMRNAKNVIYIPEIEHGELKFNSLPNPPPGVYLDPPTADAIRDELGRVHSVRGATAGPGWLIDGRADIATTWNVDARIPSGVDLLDADVRECSPAFGLLNGVADRVADYWGTSLERIVERMLAHERALGDTTSPVKHMNADMSTIEFLDHTRRVSIATSETDPLVEAMRSGEAIVLGPEYHCCLSIAMPLTGRDIVYAGDEETLRTYLAKATQAAIEDGRA